MMKRSFLSVILLGFMTASPLVSTTAHAENPVQQLPGFECITTHQGVMCVPDFKPGSPAENKFWCDDEELSHRWVNWDNCKNDSGFGNSSDHGIGTGGGSGGWWGGNPFKS